MVHVGQTRRKEKMMSESKITATKVARLGVLVLAFLAALVAVQAFGAKPAEASLWPSGVFRFGDEIDSATRFANDLEDPARLEPDGAALREAEEAAAPWTDGSGGQGAGKAASAADTKVAKRKEALKSKLEDNIEYVKERGCDIAGVAAEMGGVPPTDEQVRVMVEADVPTKYLPLENEEGSSGFATKYLLVESEEGVSGFYLVKRKQVKSELVEINHLVRRVTKASYSNDEPDVASDSNDEPDVASEILSGVIDTVCEMK
jgi:hypothetical protein